MTRQAYKVSTALRCLGVAALVAGFLGSAISISAAQQGGDVKVTSGVEADSGGGISTDTRKGVTVFRGQPTFTAQDLSPDAGALSQGLEPIVGYDGWYIDHANNRIVNCYRINGTQVGQRRIKCIDKKF